MASRPVFIPLASGSQLVEVKDIEFEWHAGMSISQKQKSIASLHDAAASSGLAKILEISSKSPNESGVKLSAFNLVFRKEAWPFGSVENAFQGSKKFRNGGPYTDLYQVTAREAKTDGRIKTSGDLMSFEFDGRSWRLAPPTLFYDWLYLNALEQNPKSADELHMHKAFTDIEFNPKKSFNCQAYSAALYLALEARHELKDALRGPNEYEKIILKYYNDKLL